MRIDSNNNITINASGLSERVTGTPGIMDNREDKLMEAANKLEAGSDSVTISDEGKKAYDEKFRKKAFTTDEGKGFKASDIEAEAARAGLNKGIIATDYRYVIPSRVNEINSASPAADWAVKADNLMKAYTSLYDEIVQGYESGQREVYVEDPEADDGYRKLTLETELEELNKAFNEQADRFKERYDTEKKAMSDIAADLSRIARSGAPVDKSRIKEANEYLDQFNGERSLPTDINEWLKESAAQFRLLYK